MKKILLSAFVFLGSISVFASHIAGGELFYEYVGRGSEDNTDRYRVTMRLFRECNSDGQALNSENVTLGIYIASNNSLYTTLKLERQWEGSPPLLRNTPGAIPCLTGDGNLCYQVGTFSATIDLPVSAKGYTLSWVRCCRQFIVNVNNSPYPENGVGATFVTSIPGTDDLPSRKNNSPQFVIKDTALVCAGKEFTIDYSATDKDGDSLTYFFCAAYAGGRSSEPIPAPANFLNPVDLPYKNPYTGYRPMGDDVTIDQKTGLIKGTAPSLPGKYVVNVCVYEWNHDTLLNIHRKDFIVKVGDCDFAAAKLKPNYITCDGFTLTFQNENTSPNILSYYWDFGDRGTDTDTSTEARPTYTFPDSGTYNIKLVINRGDKCSDSTVTKALVYPGFIPDFDIDGSCVINPFKFIDRTTTKYGVVNSWYWNFGDASTLADTSLLQNPAYTYPGAQTANVSLVVTNSKGCTDTIAREIPIPDKPVVTIPFTDTLICKGDTLQLNAESSSVNAVYSWSPSYRITNTSIQNPLVFPDVTTTYIATANDRGCINSDTATVNVINDVFVDIGKDTTICLTDAINLFPASNALHFAWAVQPGITDSTQQNQIVQPLQNTQYLVTASVGGCEKTDVINVNVVPYPLVDAGEGGGICYGKTIQLNASMVASNFLWSPTNTLLNANTLSPTAGPQQTTTYILTVTDNKGCPKPVSDSITVTVIPPLRPFAGNDTIIVINQPLQLNATGGTVYLWSPTIGMDNPNIPNPIIILGPEYDTVLYTVKVSTPEGCTATDNIKVVVFKTKPDIFIPTGFTPNRDGLNDILRPVIAGMKQFLYFRVYNRLGNMVYSTSQQGAGWDGNYAGSPQASGTYVVVVQAIDYTGKLITKRGTAVLIR